MASSLAGTSSAWPIAGAFPPRTAPGSTAPEDSGSRFRQVAVATFPRVVENVRGLQADETAVGAGERKGFRASVYRFAFTYGVERDTFVPPVPLLMPAERAAHTRIAALEEIKDALHCNSTLLAICLGGSFKTIRRSSAAISATSSTLIRSSVLPNTPARTSSISGSFERSP